MRAEEEQEWMRRAAAGDEAAAAHLVEAFRGMVRVQARAIASSRLEVDDLMQIGSLAVWRAARAWREEVGTTPRSWIWHTIRLHFDNALKFTYRECRGGRAACPVSLDATVDEEGGMGDGLWLQVRAPAQDQPEQVVLGALWEAEMWNLIRAELSERQWVVLRGWMEIEHGETPLLAARLGMSTKSVDNALQRARRKLKASRAIREALER